ncbi:MAG: transglycosylase SLT domain-containing protein [Nitriliruptorales bacterium]|nr:transglycosylase SLT domain-containing protein [Nitriliruptorales bacterium]
MPSRLSQSVVAAALIVAVAAGCTRTTVEDPPLRPSPTPSPTAARTAPPSPSSSATPSPSPSPAAAAPDPTTVYDDPEALSQVLVRAERAIRDPATGDEELRAWAWVQQAAYRQLADTPDWHEPVLAAMPDDLRDAARHNLRATVELRALTAPRDELPDNWVIISPPPPEELLTHYKEAAAEFGIDWTYLAAIHLVESRMGRIRGDSVAGAQGPMQFLPSTWDAYGRGGDINDYGDAISAAAYYLADHGAPADMDSAIYAYNHSDHYVQAIQDHAAVMRADERAYHAYYHWRVYYRLASGDVVLPEGWESP